MEWLRDASAINEGQLLRETRDGVADGHGPLELSMLLGLNLVRLIWDSGLEPSYEISRTGKVLLDLIAEEYSEVFSPRFEEPRDVQLN